MQKPLLVEIIAYAPTAYYHCTHCEVAWREMGVNNRIHEEQMQNSLPPDLVREFQEVSAWVKELFRLYCDQVVIKVIDAASVEGFFKSIRYRARKFPAVIIDRQITFTGNALQAAGGKIASLLQASDQPPA
jgi:hypothetical protein